MVSAYFRDSPRATLSAAIVHTGFGPRRAFRADEDDVHSILPGSWRLLLLWRHRLRWCLLLLLLPSLLPLQLLLPLLLWLLLAPALLHALPRLRLRLPRCCWSLQCPNAYSSVHSKLSSTVKCRIAVRPQEPKNCEGCHGVPAIEVFEMGRNASEQNIVPTLKVYQL